MVLLVLLLALWPVLPFAFISLSEDGSEMRATVAEGRFLYFAYGSNLLAERLHINNPDAQRVGAARLDEFRLDFGLQSKLWGGNVATIVPDPSRTTWGAVWSIANEHLDDLDRQEGVGSGKYVPIQLDVLTTDGNILNCRSYHLSEKYQPSSPLLGDQLITEDHLPSKIYWMVIVTGARESELPPTYIDTLEKIPHNDFMGDIKIGNLTATLKTNIGAKNS